MPTPSRLPPPPKARPALPPAPITAPSPTPSSGSRTSPRIATAGTNSSRIKLKPVIYTLAFAAVTAMGTWYGAGLKIESEVEKEQQVRRTASVEERVRQLEGARERLVGVRRDLEGKIEGVDRRLGVDGLGEVREGGG